MNSSIRNNAIGCLSNVLKQVLAAGLVAVFSGLMSFNSPAWAANLDEPVLLTDAELNEVSAGDEIVLDEFDVFVNRNSAGYFSMDVARSAFSGAQGVFTTLQTVNSVVDLDVIVNIYLGQQI